VTETCAYLEKNGYGVTYLKARRDGRVSVDDLKNAVTDNTAIVSVMFANNETGNIQPIEEIGAFCRENGIIFHTDAVQAMSSVKIDVNKYNIDLLSFSAHKFHGPKGVGALYVRNGVKIGRLLFGGHQERGMRPGTTDAAGIIGAAEALRLTVSEMDENNKRIKEMRDRVNGLIAENVPFCSLNGGLEHRLAGNTNIAFEGVQSDALLELLDLRGVAASAGSACTAGSVAPSRVIAAISGSEKTARSSVRFTFGKDNTPEETEYAADAVKKCVEKLRGCSDLFKIIDGKTYSV
jgi:cysteine desulfurase